MQVKAVQNTNKKSMFGAFVLLHIMILIYAANGIFMKMAATSERFSLKWFGFYAISILCLGIYAIGWQQVIKSVPLTTAFANKSVTVVWGLIFGMILFGDSLSIGKIIGAALVIAGAILFVMSDNAGKEENT